MTDSWAYDGGPPLLAATRTVTLLEGVSFCISDDVGDIHTGAEQGLFFQDTRFLSRFELQVDGATPERLTVRHLAPYGAAYITRRGPRSGKADSTLLVVRRRYVGAGMVEEISLRNLGSEATAVVVSLGVEADFAALFQVKEGRAQPRGPISKEISEASLSFEYHEGGDSRQTIVAAGAEPSVSGSGFLWRVAVPPRGEWAVSLSVVPSVDGVEVTPRYELGRPVEASLPAAELAAWRRSAPMVLSRDPGLGTLFAQSVEDIGSLRVVDPESPTRSAVAAGAPWFMTLFGRDSLLASWMLLPIDPGLAMGTLHMLGRLQGAKVDPLSEEEPGRILHEVRGGLDASLALGGGVYYGSADATALFVMLLGEARRWGVSWDEIEPLLAYADRAIDWIEQYGDRDGDGLVEYQRATDHGLVNQGWKDSFDGISFASGRMAEAPIALAEVQGYAFAAYEARAALAREAGDHARARSCEERASELAALFDEKFWMADHGYFALALDRDKRPVDALASNMGQCLWTGIVAPERARRVASLLVGREMFSGFGVRTLAASMGAYNPMSYHNGSVWPHDNAIIAAGMMRYGCVQEGQRVVEAILAAARCFGGRLPELYCGFDRSEFDEPVPYPTSCYPQAWAAASPLLLLRALLRLEPDVPNRLVRCDPVVPEELLPLRVERLHVNGDLVRCRVGRTSWALSGLRSGLRIDSPPGATVSSNPA